MQWWYRWWPFYNNSSHNNNNSNSNIHHHSPPNMKMNPPHLSPKIAGWVAALRTAEAELIEWAQQFQFHPSDTPKTLSPNGYDSVVRIELHDTYIPQSALMPMIDPALSACQIYPLHNNNNNNNNNENNSANKRNKNEIHQQDPSSDHDSDHHEQYYLMHGVQVHNSATLASSSSPPLVLLHGYMNGSLYFYRNLAGLSRYFPVVYSMDGLGWGLSSRPANLLDRKYHHKNCKNKNKNDKKPLLSSMFSTNTNTNEDTTTMIDPHEDYDGDVDDVQHAEDVFCASLEAWRKHNQIDQFVLAGHSLGGYLSVAYTERYPQHVSKLVLISPVGVPDTPPPGWSSSSSSSSSTTSTATSTSATVSSNHAATTDKQQQQPTPQSTLSWRTRFMFTLFRYLFEHEYTPGRIMRMLPLSRTRSMIDSYVHKRLPALQNHEREQKALSDYLFYSTLLPGSAEPFVNKFLTTPYLLAKKPLVHRIPQLRIPSVTFLYGSHDWMDSTGGLQTQLTTESMMKTLQENEINDGESDSSAAAPVLPHPPPKVEVYRVDRAGHLLMLDNYREFNAGVALASEIDPEIIIADATMNNHNTNQEEGREGKSMTTSNAMPTRMHPHLDMPALILSRLQQNNGPSNNSNSSVSMQLNNEFAQLHNRLSMRSSSSIRTTTSS